MNVLFGALAFFTPVGLFVFFLLRSERDNPTVRLSPRQEKFWNSYSGPILFWWAVIWAFCVGRFVN